MTAYLQNYLGFLGGSMPEENGELLSNLRYFSITCPLTRSDTSIAPNFPFFGTNVRGGLYIVQVG
jgi:hypothetical protein